jgi:DNA-directed RNA polymerase specialized sigma24 family protein
MGTSNPYQHDVNAEGFVATLKQRDPEVPEAWAILLAYVQLQVAHELRSRPVEQDRAGAIEDYTSDVLLIIQTSLTQFEQRGPFSAWVDALLRRALSDINLKNTLQAVERFLQASRCLQEPHWGVLCAIIQRIESPERELLQVAIGTAHSITDVQQRFWYLARRRMIDDPQFQHLLHTLAHEGMRQATTLLNWYATWKGPTRLAERVAAGHNDRSQAPDPADPGRPPLDLLIEREILLTLNQCLSQLEQVSPKQAQAIVRRFLYQEADDQIVHALKQARPNTVRQWISRGLDSLRKCVASKLQDLS